MREKHEAIVLKSIDFKDRQKILTVFTKEKGLLSLIVKGINRKKSHLLTLTSPFTHGEFHLSAGRSDLYTFVDATILHTNNALRKSLEHIEAATTIAKALLQTQMPHKPAPSLYKLTLTYLKRLPEFDSPSTLSASFLLKLMKHEGHLAMRDTCAECPKKATHLASGEGYCEIHKPLGAAAFTEAEWHTLTILTHSLKLAELKQVKLSDGLLIKIKSLYL